MKRRQFIKFGTAGLATLAAGGSGVYSLASPRSGAPAHHPKRKSPFSFTPFTKPLPIPDDVMPVPALAGGPQCDLEAELPSGLILQAPKFYEVHIKKAMTQIIPGVDTEIWGYDGQYPGPTFRVNHNEPAIVRFHNDLDVDTIVHNHGGHTPALFDGGANVIPEQVIHPGESKDFCYPNIAPVNPVTGDQEISDFASTQWYHDHAVDLTGLNVYMGLAGFYLLSDHLEKQLILDGKLPPTEEDIPLVIQDRVFRSDGSLLYDPEEDEFDGWLGDVFVVNGKAQPFFEVRRRKYRFRILNGSNARWLELGLSSGSFLQVAGDSWLLDHAVRPSAEDPDGRRVGHVRIAPAERADVVIDFRDAPEEVFLANVLPQEDGAGPDEVENGKEEEEDRRRGVGPLLKFVVDQTDTPLDNAPNLDEGTVLRARVPIDESEIVRTRRFVFEQEGGRWAINERFFNPDRNNATPRLGTAERWILENDGGGWGHPIHIHLEGHEIQRLEGRRMEPGERAGLKDTVRLDGDVTAEVFIKFRTFPGRFVFHCHNLEHEDMAMMGVFQVMETAATPDVVSALGYSLGLAYPNPFTRATGTRFDLTVPISAERKRLALRVYSLTGQLVRTLVNERLATGHYTYSWSGTNDRGAVVNSGIYVVVARAGDYVERQRVVFVR